MLTGENENWPRRKPFIIMLRVRVYSRYTYVSAASFSSKPIYGPVRNRQGERIEEKDRQMMTE